MAILKSFLLDGEPGERLVLVFYFLLAVLVVLRARVSFPLQLTKLHHLGHLLVDPELERIQVNLLEAGALVRGHLPLLKVQFLALLNRDQLFLLAPCKVVPLLRLALQVVKLSVTLADFVLELLDFLGLLLLKASGLRVLLALLLHK